MTREVLSKSLSQAKIDELVGHDNLTYADIARMLDQGDASPSILKAIFGNRTDDDILAHWVAQDSADVELLEKGAKGELLSSIASRFGLTVKASDELPSVRRQLARYLLVNEFRADLENVDSPDELSVVPTAPTAQQAKRVSKACERLRHDYVGDYPQIAHDVEDGLGMANLDIDPLCLGRIDTFAFEEKWLLRAAGQLLLDKEYNQVLDLCNHRLDSYWLNHDLARKSQWTACSKLAQFGAELQRVSAALETLPKSAKGFVDLYTNTDNGWYQLDTAHRAVEAWVAGLDEDIDASLEKALAVLRNLNDQLLNRLTLPFGEALATSNWSVPDVLHQTKVFETFVANSSAPTAYFFVDAMRYEMGVDLSRQLEGAKDLTVTPIITALPSITQVGMAALLPGADAQFAVIDHKGKIASRIGDKVLKNRLDRTNHIKSIYPDTVDLTLGSLLNKNATKLERELRDARIVVIRSQEIDAVGEGDFELMARQVMDNILNNLARGVRKLAKAGIGRFVITADHGHQFAVEKSDDMKIPAPAGQKVELHRRCWAGRGGQTDSHMVRVSSNDLGYDSDLEFVFPRGTGVFKAGGSLSFHHGGFSLQELVIPVLSFRMETRKEQAGDARKVQFEGLPKRITNRTFSVRIELQGDLFGAASNELQVLLLDKSQTVGRAGMAVGAKCDSGTGMVVFEGTEPIEAVMLLSVEDCKACRVVVMDPKNDAILGQSDIMKIELGI